MQRYLLCDNMKKQMLLRLHAVLMLDMALCMSRLLRDPEALGKDAMHELLLLLRQLV